MERFGHNLFRLVNLRCVFCQNFETSQLGEGAEVMASELARIMLDLQEIGCHNINFVTPEHVVPQILEALVIAVERGLRLPLVYNTSAYDSLESIRLMDGLVTFTCRISNSGRLSIAGNISWPAIIPMPPAL